ncbi:MAG TPA: hypothetical protein VF510_05615 [Ktedonobacterales bacterium]
MRGGPVALVGYMPARPSRAPLPFAQRSRDELLEHGKAELEKIRAAHVHDL